MIKYSIIVPVYQTKNYLAECIESVLSQTYPHFEIILIDDGSTDGSSELCDYYSKKDNRIVAIHKKNEGQGVARNIGVSIAKGEYIIFLDSDDWWNDVDALNKIDKLSDKTDLVFFELSIMNRKEIKIDIANKLKDEYDNGQLFMYDLLNKDPSFSWYPVLYAFKKEIWENNNILFPKNTFFEDTATVYKIVLFSNKVKVLKDVFYCYRQSRNESTTKSVNCVLLSNHIDVCGNCINYVIAADNINKDLKKLLLNNFGCGYVDVVNHLHRLSKHDFNRIKQILIKNYYILDYVNIGKQRYMALIIKIFGIDFSSFILGLIQKIKYLIFVK